MFARCTRVRAAAALASALGAYTVQNAAAAEAFPQPGSFAVKRPPAVVRKAERGQDVSVTLEYFALRGLGELPRLILEVTGIPYDCVFHFMTGSYKEYAPFGQLPLLRDDGLLICQSSAICRHLARKACIDGKDVQEMAKVDMFYELSKDMEAKKAAIHDPDGHSDGGRLKTMLSIANNACDGQYFVGGSLTLADIAMFSVLHKFAEVAPNSLDSYPKLAKFVEKFAEQPAVDAYLKSNRRMPITPNEDGKQPHAGLPGYAFKSPAPPGAFVSSWPGP